MADESQRSRLSVRLKEGMIRPICRYPCPRFIRFSTLEAICQRLDCQPGDILEYQPAQPDEPDP